jgi:hypothetical protein
VWRSSNRVGVAVSWLEIATRAVAVWRLQLLLWSDDRPPSGSMTMDQQKVTFVSVNLWVVIAVLVVIAVIAVAIWVLKSRV